MAFPSHLVVVGLLESSLQLNEAMNVTFWEALVPYDGIFSKCFVEHSLPHIFTGRYILHISDEAM